MTIRSAIATIAGCTLLGAAIGAGAGYALGTHAPDYYRAVCRSGRKKGFDPVQVGVGLGLEQGVAGGVVVGLAVVALLSLRDVRLQRATALPAPSDGRSDRSSVTDRLVLLVAGSCLSLTFFFCAGFVLGALRGEGDAYHRRFLEERDALAPLLDGDPAFAGVEVLELSSGGVWLMGDVTTAENHGRLHDGVVRAVGERRAREVMAAVRPKRQR